MKREGDKEKKRRDDDTEPTVPEGEEETKRSDFWTDDGFDKRKNGLTSELGGKESLNGTHDPFVLAAFPVQRYPFSQFLLHLSSFPFLSF